MPSSTGSLSNGAIAGIALGSVIGLGGAIGFVTWLIKRRHDRKPSLAKMDADANSKSHGAGICNEETRYEMHGVSLVELSSIETMLNEMDASSERKQYIKRVDDRAAAGYDGAYRGN